MNIPPSVSRAASRLALTAGLLTGPGCDVSDIPQGCTTTQNTAPFGTVMNHVHAQAITTLGSMATLLEAEKAQSTQAEVTFGWGTHATLPVVRIEDSFVECHTQDDASVVCGIGTLSNSKTTPGYNATNYTEINADDDTVILYPPDNGIALTIKQSQGQCQAFDGTHWGTPCENDTQACTNIVSDIDQRTRQVYNTFVQKIGSRP